MADSSPPLLTISHLAKVHTVHHPTLRLHARPRPIKPAHVKLFYLSRHAGINRTGGEIILPRQRPLAKIRREIGELRQNLTCPIHRHLVECLPRHALGKASARTLKVS